MTTAADRADETAFEAVLAGRPAPAGAAGFTAFTQAVRATATQPGRPSPALAELLATGLIVDQPSPSPRTANRRRRRMWFFTAIIAKIASAGAVAQAATGAGIVVVGLTTAGASGVLPGQAQQTFDSVVQSFTGADQNGGATVTPTGSTSPSSSAATSTTASTGTSTATPTAVKAAVPSRTEDEDRDEAHPSHPDNYGGQVSSWAHERGDDAKPTKATPTRSVAEDRQESSKKGRSGGDD